MLGKAVRYQMAQRDYEMAEFYCKTGHYGAAAIYFNNVIKDFPETQFAKMSRDRLEEIKDLPPEPPQRLKWLREPLPRPKQAEVQVNPRLRSTSAQSPRPSLRTPHSALRTPRLLPAPPRLRRLPGRRPLALSAGHPHGLRADVRIQQLPPPPGRAAHRGGRQGDRSRRRPTKSSATPTPTASSPASSSKTPSGSRWKTLSMIRGNPS